MPKFNSTEYLAVAKRKAKKVGVDVRYSKDKNKKLDVLKDGKKITSIGHKSYSDHIQHGDDKRRANYKSRHQKYRTKVGSRSYYADKILW